MNTDYSTNITDKQWQVIEKVINPQERTRKHSLRDIKNAILYINKTGCQWRLLPREFGPWQTAFFWSPSHFPLVEEGPDMGLENILAAVRELMKADAAGEKVILHCSFGNNRSRTVAEAFHFKKMGFQLEDEYKGYPNHLAYNCGEGHLPPLSEIEQLLK